MLANYATYYNGVRTHLALDKDSPLHRPAQTVGRIAPVTWPRRLRYAQLDGSRRLPTGAYNRQAIVRSRPCLL